MARSHLRNVGLGAMLVLPVALLIADVVILLWKVHALYFESIPWTQYLTAAWGIAAAFAAPIPVLVIANRIAKAVMTGRPAKRQRTPIDQTALIWANGIKHFLARPSRSLPTTAALLAVGIMVVLIDEPEMSPRTSSPVVAIRRGPDKLIYVADREHGQILVFRSSDLANPAKVIPIGSHGNQPGRGAPESMIEFRPTRWTDFSRRALHLLFVTDTSSDAVYVIDLNFDAVIGDGIKVGKAPRGLALTPDHRKLFVSNEQPIPNGTISVIDVSASKPEDFRVVSKIEGVNCPEGLALSPGGKRLYVATQCGGDLDPVFVIDTATNDKLSSIPRLAVGTNVAVSPSGAHLYVSRGNFLCSRGDGTERGSPFSVVNLGTHTIKTICLRTSVGAMALSRDMQQRYLFLANGSRLTIFDRQKLDSGDAVALDTTAVQLNDIPLEAPVIGIAIADDNSVYAYLPEAHKLFIYAPTGLTPE
jgi:YVTN family beta-propeller protein